MSMADNVAGANSPAAIEAIQESLRQTAALMAELREQSKETDRRMQETDRRMQETAEQMKDTDRRLKKAEGLFTSQWGKLMESLVDGDLVPLLNERGIDSDASVTAYAERQGLFVIRAPGSSASIVNPPDFEPRVFG